MNNEPIPYGNLCTEYYEIERPRAPVDALNCYLKYAKEANGPILEPMCGSGRFLIPLLKQGYTVTGFDYSPDMLKVCREKCETLGLKSILKEATFKTFDLDKKYNLIFIPSGSFCHLIDLKDIKNSLQFISSRLNPGGKFVFEVETLYAVRELQGVWKGSWVDRKDGSKIVRYVLSKFNPITQIETALFKYELWEKNTISRTEVESFHVRHYETAEIEQLLEEQGLKVIGKWEAENYSQLEVTEKTSMVLYECLKI